MLILWETGSEQLMDDANRNVAAVLIPCSDLFGSDPFWRGWLEPTCIGCGSVDFTGGAEWILRLRSSKSASSISN